MIAQKSRMLLKRKNEKATPVGDHNGSLCMETVVVRDQGCCCFGINT